MKARDRLSITNSQVGGGQWGAVPRAPHPLQDSSAFLSNWDPSFQDPQPVGSRASSAAIWRAGPGDSAWPRSQWGRQLASASRGEQRRGSCCPRRPNCVSGSSQVTIPRQEKKHESVSCSVVSDSVTPWTVARQGPLSMGFSRQECWSGLPCPPPGDLPTPGIEPGSPALQADSSGKPPPRQGSFPTRLRGDGKERSAARSPGWLPVLGL